MDYYSPLLSDGDAFVYAWFAFIGVEAVKSEQKRGKKKNVDRTTSSSAHQREHDWESTGFTAQTLEGESKAEKNSEALPGVKRWRGWAPDDKTDVRAEDRFKLVCFSACFLASLFLLCQQPIVPAGHNLHGTPTRPRAGSNDLNVWRRTWTLGSRLEPRRFVLFFFPRESHDVFSGEGHNVGCLFYYCS